MCHLTLFGGVLGTAWTLYLPRASGYKVALYITYNALVYVLVCKISCMVETGSDSRQRGARSKVAKSVVVLGPGNITCRHCYVSHSHPGSGKERHSLILWPLEL